MTIKPPTKPKEPEYESEDLPDQKHQWIKDSDGEPDSLAFDWGGEYGGPICELCEFGNCNCCVPEIYNDTSCLRKQAAKRNLERKRQYNAELKKYEAQMEYYEQIKKEAA